MNRDRLYLQHSLDALAKISAYAAVGRDSFMAESHWQDAVIRQLEIVGEATKHLSPELRLRHSEVPWKRIAGLRDVLIHNYMGVDLDAVWALTQRDVSNSDEIF
ncbi:MAG: HepT-like ribonuclease domain-containing protein [Dehalococcoidia bacterium]